MEHHYGIAETGGNTMLGILLTVVFWWVLLYALVGELERELLIGLTWVSVGITMLLVAMAM